MLRNSALGHRMDGSMENIVSNSSVCSIGIWQWDTKRGYWMYSQCGQLERKTRENASKRRKKRSAPVKPLGPAEQHCKLRRTNWNSIEIIRIARAVFAFIGHRHHRPPFVCIEFKCMCRQTALAIFDYSQLGVWRHKGAWNMRIMIFELEN